MNLKKVYNGGAPVWVQHVFTVIGTIIGITAIGSVAWTQMSDQVDDNQTLSEKNGVVLEAVDDRLDSLETGLAVLQTKVDLESVRQQEYREEVLSYIRRNSNSPR